MSLPEGVERDYPLSRLTTVRAGGAADFFARPETEEQVIEFLAWAESEGLPIGVVGSGSNLLVSDEGFHGLVMKLAGELTRVERNRTHIVCGGGARLPSAAAKAAGWGLTGIEFGVNIPGTVGGAVRMNANAMAASSEGSWSRSPSARRRDPNRGNPRISAFGTAPRTSATARWWRSRASRSPSRIRPT
jgi:UDP-N-acetylenolpyruvoylglucosamine reductase